jgi:hypothetical protein
MPYKPTIYVKCMECDSALSTDRGVTAAAEWLAEHEHDCCADCGAMRDRPHEADCPAA